MLSYDADPKGTDWPIDLKKNRFRIQFGVRCRCSGAKGAGVQRAGTTDRRLARLSLSALSSVSLSWSDQSAGTGPAKRCGVAAALY